MTNELILILAGFLVYVIFMAGILVWLYAKLEGRILDLEDRVDNLETLFPHPPYTTKPEEG